MVSNALVMAIKFLGIDLAFSICFLKISNTYSDIRIWQKLLIALSCIPISIIQCNLSFSIPIFFLLFMLVFIYGVFYSIVFKLNISKSITMSIMALSMSCIFSLLSMLFSSFIFASFCSLTNSGNTYHIYIAFTIIMAFFNIVLILLLFKVRKFRNGFTFLNNDYITLQVLIITTIFIFAYSVISNFSRQNMFTTFIGLCFIILIVIKQVFLLYQKQKIQTQTLKDYEKQLADIQKELRVTKSEKDKIVKSNHEFYHRQEALKTKLNHLANCNSEFANELSDITDRIDLLTNEYESKIRNQKQIETFGIEELDDMLIYFKEECMKYNIDFTCKVQGNINKIVDTIITKSEFETLIGDLLRNAIIAINHSDNINKSIMLAFGLKDGFYELDIYDTGIPFEISTLLTLGVEKCSTHLNEGGTGIGFITTFETLNRTNASIVITEFDSNTYSKCIGIKFDNHNAYIINTNRVNEIKLLNKDNRQIVFNNTKDRI